MNIEEKNILKIKEIKEDGNNLYEFDIELLNQKLNEYKQKIEKAIEYINKHLYMESSYGIQHATFDGKPNYDFNCFDLINILKGEDEDE